MEYCVDGEYHRSSAPAVIRNDGTEEYYLDNKLHRVGGPAVINIGGELEYWLLGKRYPRKIQYDYALIRMVAYSKTVEHSRKNKV